MVRKYYLLQLLFLASSLFMTGCSVSYSTGKSSDTVSVFLDSVSASSSSVASGDNLALLLKTYGDDIAAATRFFLHQQESPEQYLRDIAAIATNYGIIDWQQQSITYQAMGKGIFQAGVAEDGIIDIPYFKSLAGTTAYALLLKGYHQS
jgi:hypothetical protein